MKLSVVIPARNEEGCLETTLVATARALCARGIPYELLVVDDGGSDATFAVASRCRESIPGIIVLQNGPPNGFGLAMRRFRVRNRPQSFVSPPRAACLALHGGFPFTWRFPQSGESSAVKCY
jgi:cellulose synthase/poly-beta-1,6-N-acetylglucosamine synthase-like glycosyltransferase